MRRQGKNQASVWMRCQTLPGLRTGATPAHPSDSTRAFALVRFEPDLNLYRYIEAELAEDLFGVVVLRRWGRIGVSENVETLQFDSREAASLWMTTYHARKVKKGYSACGARIPGAFLVAARMQRRTAEKQELHEKIVDLGFVGSDDLFAPSHGTVPTNTGCEVIQLRPKRA